MEFFTGGDAAESWHLCKLQNKVAREFSNDGSNLEEECWRLQTVTGTWIFFFLSFFLCKFILVCLTTEH